MKLIEIENLTVQLGGHTALNNVDLAIESGEIVTIVGPNGSGKSTLIRTIIGALSQTSGKITRREGLRIGYVPQRLFIDPTLPITVNRFLCLPRKADPSAMEEALSQANVSDLATQQMTRLSGGQFQRVLFARALLERPELLILDEATQGLDQSGSADFYRQIADTRDRTGCAVLMVSHDLHVVMSASDRVICLNGHICCQGKPEYVASAPEYRLLFGEGTKGTLALYRHHHHSKSDKSEEKSEAIE
ncbi:metal ABC transporter ATP-binding protein [Cohaesibacter celericrescens]|uniref:Zinc ABC transporter ATP-binding protein ZnuC n=1 Tax=Cohaesibacter celericrescens TaxID=2067669 RepID=A0A2N5XRQ7_9HYPH|nr:metal ABC transporter ATP-binding protein [Cohaesibacter celericrescens]PLW77174.1 zinc ABC transporter ATP-binding protein ZnuC [Cohaesibacter celericrescens]